MSTADMSGYVDMFLEEANDVMQALDEELLKLEQEGFSEAVVQKLFRSAHTLKGSSAAMGFHSISILTHEMENVLDGVRARNIQVTMPLIKLFFKCVDELNRNINLVKTPEEMSDSSELIVELRVWSEGNRVETKIRNRILSVLINPSCQMKQARAHIIVQHLSDNGTIHSVTPSLTQTDQDELYQNLHIDFTPKEDQIESVIAGLLNIPEVLEVKEIREQGERSLPSSGEVPCDRPNPSTGRNAKLQSVRVDVSRLETLINLVGELMIDHSRINRLQLLMSQQFRGHELVSELGTVCDHAANVIAELQNGVMKSRMLPVDHLFARFPRMLRDLSDQLGKKVNLQIEGKDTELDRTVIEEIGDPLIHLLRNAIDHGIELPEDRLKQGKPVEGSIILSASHEESQVVIRISDDGKGIDPDRIREKAIEKGIISSEEGRLLSDQECVKLIFRAGLSTSTVVSDVSGRGVGMDIVLSHIEKIGGMIDIVSEKSVGTSFTIKLPLTMAMIPGLLVEVAGQTYILPMTNVVELIRMSSEHAETIAQTPVLEFRDQILPLKHLRRLLSLEEAETQQQRKMHYIVVIGYGDKKAALIVDKLIGNQEIVVKSLGGFLGKIKGVSSSTILGNGNVGMILDIQDLVNRGA